MPQDQKKLRLGDILLGANLITSEQLETALQTQKSTGSRLGEVLVGLGFISEIDLARAMARQLNYPFIANPEGEAEQLAVRLLPESMARRHHILPLKADEQNGTIILAMADPLNFPAVDEVAMTTGKRVKPVVVTEKSLQRAMSKSFGLIQAGESLMSESSATSDSESGLISQRYDIASDEAVQSQVIKAVNTVLEQALSQRASDIHIEPLEQGVRVRYRVDGVLTEAPTLPRNLHAAIISRIKVMAQMDIAERRIPQDGRLEITTLGRRLDLRVNSVPTIYGEKIAMRILDRGTSVRDINEIGMEPDAFQRFMDMIHRPSGMVLVTGPTGSGKTTTLTAVLAHLNTPDRHIITIEDPVEYNIPGINQVQVNVKAGLTFATGLRAFLRQDPNVVMVGEIRDQETADIAVRAALTGHQVFSTIHTNDAVGTVGRLLDMGVEPFLLASGLMGVVTQRLVRCLCSHCKVAVELDANHPDAFILGAGSGLVRVYKPVGCALCDNSGFQGRRALFEVLAITPPIREKISRGASAADLQQAALKDGMRTLWEDGIVKVLGGVTTLEEVRRVAFAEE